MHASNQVKRLYKSRTDRMIDGVCGGLAEYLGLDSTLVRVAWVGLAILGGMGILLYIVAMIVMPTNPLPAEQGSPAPSRRANTKFWGILLVGVGVVWLLSNLDVYIWRHWWGLSWDVALPVLLILAGVAFMVGGIRHGATSDSQTGSAGPGSPPPARDHRGVPDSDAGGVSMMSGRLYRSRTDRKLMGVCGGIGAHMNVDPTFVRILFVVAGLASIGVVVLLYIILAIVVPEEPVVMRPS